MPAATALRVFRTSGDCPLFRSFPHSGVLRSRRRTYAGYAMHLALACLAIGVAGSSLGTRQKLARLSQGESLHWAGRDVRFVRLRQQRLPEKLVLQAELEVTGGGAAPFTLLPAQEYYFLAKRVDAGGRHSFHLGRRLLHDSS